MKKHAKVWGILIASGIVISVNALYQNPANKESGAVQPQKTTSVQTTPAPQSTVAQRPAGTAAPFQEEVLLTPSAAASEQEEGSTTEKRNFALWHYDKKTCRLTISGNGEMIDESPENSSDGAVPKNYMITNTSPKNLDMYDVSQKAREVIIEPGVTAINASAFCNFVKLEKVTIPDSVEKINDYAFYGCESLKEITVPDHVKKLGRECFCHCKSLKKITLGKNVAAIGEGAFGNLPKLRNVTLKAGNQYLITKNGTLYHKKKKILYLNYAKSAVITIDPGTKKIADFAFQWNNHVRQITIPASVTAIGGGAMYHCGNLRRVLFAKHSKLKKIKKFSRYYDYSSLYGCFQHCNRLEEISLPESLETTETPSDAFVDCPALKKIYFGKKYKGEIYIKSNSLVEISISKDNQSYCSKNGILYDKKMETLLVYPCKKNTDKFHVPKSVKKISFSAFQKCKKLQSVVIYGQKTKIDLHTFRGSKHITIYAPKNSNAQKYAKKHKMKFVEI